MAHCASALKRNRQSIKKRSKNRAAKSTIKSEIENLAKLSADEMKKMASSIISIIDKACKVGIIHKNKAARQKSKIMKKLAGKK